MISFITAFGGSLMLIAAMFGCFMLGTQAEKHDAFDPIDDQDINSISVVTVLLAILAVMLLLVRP